MTALAPTLALNDGRAIPQLGLGTSPLDDAEAETAVTTAIALGYRHIDTAVKYANERGVGAGIAASGVARDELFVTTKLDGGYQGEDRQGEGRAVAGLEASLSRLGLDYVDLLLIHWPLPQRDEYVSTWRTFVELRERGLARSIGVSNFLPAHLERIIGETGVTPAVNQIQVNPFVVRAEQRLAHADHGIVTQAYSPLGSGRDLVTDERIAAIALEHGRTPGQVVLRWHTQQGIVPVPRSRNAERIAQNLAVFDFDLTPANLSTIAELAGERGPGVDAEVTGH